MLEENPRNFGYVLSDEMGATLNKAKTISKLEGGSRELSLVITKLEEALLWLGVCSFIPRTQEEIDNELKKELKEQNML